MKRKVAVFDIDGTIFRSSLLIEVTDALIQEGIFPKNAGKQYAVAYKNWLERKDSYEKYITAVVAVFDRHIKGVKHGAFLKVAKKVVTFHQNRVYRFTRDLVRDCKNKGFFLLAISHSPTELVQEFCKKLGFNRVYGRATGVDPSGKMTGDLLYPDLIMDKAKILQRAVEKNDLTLKGSIGVGDTATDVAFLSLVDRPICFNPNKKLYDYAIKHKWTIAVERKDVIYYN